MTDTISSYLSMYKDDDSGYWFSHCYYEENYMFHVVEKAKEIYPTANIGYRKLPGNGYILRVRFNDDADEAEFIMKECP